MEREELQQLLTQPESATLEFKRKPYSLDDSDPEAKKRQRDELIKDILALANGSPLTVGDKAYLIIGADDKLQPDGTRKLFDVDPGSLTKQQILKLVNAACQPRLQDVECEHIELEGKRLLVITIWPTPYLHETTRNLTTSQAAFTKYIAFTRHDETIEVATQREREAILKLKQIHLADTRKAPPTRFGAVVGALVGAFMAGAATTIARGKSSPLSKEELNNRVIAGSIVGAPIGALSGWTYTGILETRYEWYFLSRRERAIYGVVYIGVWILLLILYRWIWPTLISPTKDDRRDVA